MPRFSLVYADRALRYVPEDEAAAEPARRGRRPTARAARGAQPQRRPHRRGRHRGGACRAHAHSRSPCCRPTETSRARPRRSSRPKTTEPLADEAQFALAVALRRSGRRRRDVGRARGSRGGRCRHHEHDPSCPGAPGEPRRESVGGLRGLEESPLQAARALRPGGTVVPRPARQADAERVLSWALDLPSMAQSLTGAPMRLINLRWTPDFASARLAAYHGRRYLDSLPRRRRGRRRRRVARGLRGEAPELARSARALQAPWRGRPRRARDARRECRRARCSRAPCRKNGAICATRVISASQRTFRKRMRPTRRRATPTRRRLTATPHRIEVSRGFLVEKPRGCGLGGTGPASRRSSTKTLRTESSTRTESR